MSIFSGATKMCFRAGSQENLQRRGAIRGRYCEITNNKYVEFCDGLRPRGTYPPRIAPLLFILNLIILCNYHSFDDYFMF